VIIDCHCHAGEGDGLTGPWDTRASLKNFLRWSEEAGIARTVLFPAFHTDYRLANRAVARLVARQPSRFFGFAFIHPVQDRGRVRELVREAVEEHGFVGLKVHRHDARITREICLAARAWQLPVLYDVMGEVSVCELLASEYPDVPFIIPHLGSFADDWRAQQAFIDPLTRHSNIFTDTSGVRRFDLLLQALRRAGPGKILFGSDGPWLHPAVEIAKVHALKLSLREESLVLGDNFLRLISRVKAMSVPENVAGVAAAVPSARSLRDPWISHPGNSGELLVV
jgi:uncharacterized protein